MARIIRTILVVAVSILLLSLAMFNAGRKPSTAELVWNKEMTIGDLNAPNHYIMYTDLLCPYCDFFARQIQKNREEFERDYIKGKNILWEVRLTDFLREFGHDAPVISEWGAEAGYCAKRSGKFWEFYYAALDALERDYHSKGIGISKNAPKIADMKESYWLEVGKSVGLGDDFKKCYENHEALKEVRENTEKAAQALGNGGGLPYFKFNNYVMTGMDPNDGWKEIKTRLDRGISK